MNFTLFQISESNLFLSIVLFICNEFHGNTIAVNNIQTKITKTTEKKVFNFNAQLIKINKEVKKEKVNDDDDDTNIHG